MSWIYIAFTFFLIMDPVGNVSSFMKLVKDYPQKRQVFLAAREMLIVLAIMLFFYLMGEYVLRVLDISDTAARLASGLVIFLGALHILFPTNDSPRSNLPKGEPYITPVAIPLLAGPALMGTVMLFAKIVPDHASMLFGILGAWVVTSLIMLGAPKIYRLVGTNGLIACEKLMGMILVLIGIQRFMDGVKMFLAM
ncbi:MAG: antibiotic transporter [Chlamydiia bacterium]|nr:antibiotic transporter [Chlamydiia bacterium]